MTFSSADGILPPIVLANVLAFKLWLTNDFPNGGAQRDFTILGSSVTTQIAISLYLAQ